MSESLYVGAYWGNRKETANQCAARLESLLTVLSGCDDVFSRWYEKGRSAGEAARREISITRESLKALLERGRNRRGRDGAVVEELGFRLSIWNGLPGEQADLTFQCGSCASTPNTWIPNSCLLNLPTHAAGERLRKVGLLLRIVDAFIRACQPTWAVVTSHEYRETAAKAEPGAPLVGWLTYLRVSPNRLPPLPPGTRVVPAGDSGSVIITTDAPLTMENSEHVSSANQVWHALSTAGLLQRSV